jgi:mRNA-degrading endonuclease toxin of MazEF toxin-antitoxin module
MVAGQSTLALCDALISVDPTQRLGDPIDYLSLPALREIDESLALLLDLDVV